MPDRSYPERIETDRLVLERLSTEHTDLDELADRTLTDSWQTEVTEHMPWFRFEDEEHVSKYIDHCEQQWTDREKANYTIRLKASEPEAGELVGLTGYNTDWEAQVASTGIVLAKPFWGRGYAGERIAALLELAFERHEFSAYETEIAAVNERSRRMAEKYVVRFGGKHEGLLRHYSQRQGGEALDYHRYTILREEYEAATQ
ncbi:GNAT family N-acetyltransferase [Halorussus halophilus]|uniref:GNAT family N-acetyltransferase n=1 Tax=Halorussus halophilus TaxID=2650975 RepID=UPI00130138C3|nr:GNAT family protein [Halorussus halophilus]